MKKSKSLSTESSSTLECRTLEQINVTQRLSVLFSQEIAKTWRSQHIDACACSITHAFIHDAMPHGHILYVVILYCYDDTCASHYALFCFLEPSLNEWIFFACLIARCSRHWQQAHRSSMAVVQRPLQCGTDVEQMEELEQSFLPRVRNSCRRVV